MGRTKVVDLTNGTDRSNHHHNTGGNTPKAAAANNVAAAGSKANPSSSKVMATKEFQFPPGLQFQQMLCTQRHKDSHLYGYILYFMSLLQQHKRSQSSILIFCNSIAGVRRVGLTLTTLRLPVRMLHANMQQVRVTDQIVVIFTCVCSGCAMWNVGREEDTNKPEREQGICILSKWPNIFLSITISMRALVNNL